ncbi:hypothetical protein BD309DRAFT_871610, partial [Dichomitus squalens]
FPLSRLGKAKILWVFGVYGLPEVWVRRVSTVYSSYKADSRHVKSPAPIYGGLQRGAHWHDNSEAHC